MTAISRESKTTPSLLDGPADTGLLLILAHGAGQGPDAPFMAEMARRIAAGGVRVVRPWFPYMAKSAADGRRRPPDRLPVLCAALREVVAAERGSGAWLVIGGKSMGGRVAATLADELGVAGLVCLGFPFHPPGKPERTRLDALSALSTPTLICQGERDPFGHRAEVAGYGLCAAVQMAWIPDGEHSFKPRVASGRTWAQNLDAAAAAVLGFCADLA
ncbi:alpha/beta family hydrolase [Thiohalocapsa sp. ML1]|uniref:alpha/beta family hydrolase n=1 Tax=Thiohalocapsa sp. ML1 TaxID=1431688 RepID=UPI000732388A|nr:alpha/beta family hydrolase [Thiohalocapsa sp. ML1]